ncbi:hypothetical protein ACH4ZU_08020 [Streptomyces sp. NPDC020472]
MPAAKEVLGALETDLAEVDHEGDSDVLARLTGSLDATVTP